MFTLDNAFVKKYSSRFPPWGPVGYITYKRTYARTKPDGNTESWHETCERVVNGVFRAQENHCEINGLAWNEAKAQHSAKRMFSHMYDMKFLPPGRGLWMMGTDYITENGGAALNNCAFVSTRDDFIGACEFLMDMSMLGVGVGFDTLGAGRGNVVKAPTSGEFVWRVADSRQGWVDTLRLILRCYLDGQSLPDRICYSGLRPAGAPIRGFGGVSSGPLPLKELVQELHDIFKLYTGKYIDSTLITNVMNAIGRCVVSGNVRRSAELALGNPDDIEFLHLKNPAKNALRLAKYGWCSNNSIAATVGMDYTDASALTRLHGEPGYIWLENARWYGRTGELRSDKHVAGMNPCAEQTLEDHELCCLVETFPAHCAGLPEYEQVLKSAYLYAKTVTLIPTHNSKTNAVMLRNRRIGCSMSGIVQAINKFGYRRFMDRCKNAYTYVRKLDEIYSDWLCVRNSIKVTSVKPSGTVSLLPGATPGIHYPHSKFYFRVIRFASNSKYVIPLRDAGYRCEVVTNEPNTTAVYFPVAEKNFERGKTEVSMFEQVKLAADMQRYWADNAVSCTITFNPYTEGHLIPRVLEMFETELKSISFLPLTDHGYEHAPYQEITEAEYRNAVSGLRLPVRFDETEHEHTDQYCDGGKCEI